MLTSGALHKGRRLIIFGNTVHKGIVLFAFVLVAFSQGKLEVLVAELLPQGFDGVYFLDEPFEVVEILIFFGYRSAVLQFAFVNG